MKRALLIFLLIATAWPAQAIIGNTFVYAKTVLKIIPKADGPVSNDKKDGVAITKDELLPHLHRVTKEFTVDVRPAGFLEQKDFIARQPFADNEGMLILIEPPAPIQVTATRMLATADVIFANEDGFITKIAPSLALTGLTEPVDSGSPVHALVYLKAGMAAKSDIEVGDRIENSTFKTHPVVIQ